MVGYFEIFFSINLILIKITSWQYGQYLFLSSSNPPYLKEIQYQDFFYCALTLGSKCIHTYKLNRRRVWGRPIESEPNRAATNEE